jgi:hypothetical protein
MTVYIFYFVFTIISNLMSVIIMPIFKKGDGRRGIETITTYSRHLQIFVPLEH